MMTDPVSPYDLVIGDRAYSSWSLRGWLLFDAFGIPVRTHSARLYTDELAQVLKGFFPGRTAPTMRTPDGTVVPETIAIAEELATRHPEAGLWPKDPHRRAIARALAAEMHAGFSALRNHCPMNLRVSYADCAPPQAVLDDLTRLEVIWGWAFAECGDGPWLTGAYCAADAFFAPVAARIAGYGLPMGPRAMEYVAAHLAHPSFRRWRAMGLVDGADQPVYARDWPRRDWPGPAPRPATPAAHGTGAVNAACPYSGRPVTHFLDMDGRRYGFCNAFCRDKTAADPEAWPAFMALVAAT